MKKLHQLVVSKVAMEWKTIADYLEFTLPMIKIIEEKCRCDPVKCCTELFRQWLSSDYGVGPKTWSTLIKILKEIRQLLMATKEIEQSLKCKCKFYPKANQLHGLSMHNYCSYNFKSYTRSGKEF